jgi:hypothetical protein
MVMQDLDGIRTRQEFACGAVENARGGIRLIPRGCKLAMSRAISRAKMRQVLFPFIKQTAAAVRAIYPHVVPVLG